MANSILAKMAVEITANSAQFKSELSKANTSLKSFGSELKFISGSVKTFFAANIIGGIGREIFNTTSQFQKLGAVLTNALGSRSAAQRSLKDIVEFSSKTPFQVAELTQSYVKLVNQGFKPTITQLRQLGDLAASTGKNFDQLTEAIIDAQTGEFERLKEFGIRASKNGDIVTFTFKGVEKQVNFTAGAIREYITSLGDLQGVSGSMAAISGTLEGKMSNLGDNVDRLLTFVGNSSSGLVGGLLDLANNALGALNDALDDNVGKLQEEQAELNVLVGAITDANTGEEVRSKLIEELNQKYPDFLKNLDAEKVTNEQLTARLKDVNDQFFRKIALQSAEERFKEVQSDILDLIDEEVSARKRLEKVRSGQASFSDTRTKGGAEGNTAQQNQKQEELRLEEKIARIQGERTAIQKDLSDKLLEYNNALGIFNGTNNDYFEGVTDSTTATREFAKALADLKKLTTIDKSQLPDAGNVNIPGEFKDVDKEFNDLIEEGTAKLIEQTEAVLGLRDAYSGLVINTDEAAQIEAAALEQRQKDIETLIGLTQAAESFGAALVSGQQEFGQALANLTLDVIDLYLKQALAAAIAKSIEGGPLPVGLALAAASVGIVRGLFSKAVGRSSGGGSGGGGVSRPSASSNTQDSNAKLILGVQGQIKGNDIFLSTRKTSSINEATKVRVNG
jgi:hypothetical protein